MYLIRYEEFVGSSEQYALSAMDVLDAVRDIDAHGGSLRGITFANETIEIDEIERRAEAERLAQRRN